MANIVMSHQKAQKELSNLYKEVDSCFLCKTSDNKLNHILGFGAFSPRFMLVLINPTYRNLSSRPGYQGPRFPFIGVRHFWQVLAKGGLIDKKVAFSLPPGSLWEPAHTKALQEQLLKHRLFITNVVKCCFNHSFYPQKSFFEYNLKILSQEISLVRPKFIIAFGAITLKYLTGKNIVLGHYFSKPTAKREIFSEKLTDQKFPVLPCYFPVGRGNPTKASLVLKEYSHRNN